MIANSTSSKAIRHNLELLTSHVAVQTYLASLFEPPNLHLWGFHEDGDEQAPN